MLFLDSFWSLARKTTNATATRRFLLHYEEYLEAVVLEAQDREGGRVRSISDYYKLRRGTAAVYAALDMLLLTELPDSVLDHPIIAELGMLCNDMILISNASAGSHHCPSQI